MKRTSSIEEIMNTFVSKERTKIRGKGFDRGNVSTQFKDKVFSNKNAPLCDDENLECCATSVFSCVPGAIQKPISGFTCALQRLPDRAVCKTLGQCSAQIRGRRSKSLFEQF